MGEMVSFETKAKFEDLRQENERLRAENAKLRGIVDELRSMEIINRLEADVDRLRTDYNAMRRMALDSDETNDRLRAALKPFADLSLWRDTYPDGPDILSSGSMMTQYISADMVRAARAALAYEQGAQAQHDYVPSAMHVGDCAVCGHVQDADVHKQRGETSEPTD